MTIIIQLGLICAIVLIMLKLLRSQGQRAQALRRVGTLLFISFAAMSILFPDVWTYAARIVGVDRGVDLILYGLVIAFLGFVVTTYGRLRDMEYRHTQIARTLALQKTYSDRDDRDTSSTTP